MLLEARLNGLLNDSVSLSERLIYISHLKLEMAVDVVVVYERTALAGKAVVYGYRRFLLFVFYDYLFPKVLYDGPVRPNDYSNGLANVPYIVFCKALPVGGYHVKVVVSTLRYVPVGYEPIAIRHFRQLYVFDDSPWDA